MPPRRRALLRQAALACLAACAAAPERRPPDLAAVADLRVAAFPGAARVLDGFAPADDDPALRVGDAALFALEFARGDEVQRQLLLLEVSRLGTAMARIGEREFTLRTRTDVALTTTRSDGSTQDDVLSLRDVTVTVRRFDAAGNELTHTDAMLYEEALCAGFWPDTDLDATRRDRLLASVLAFSLQNLANAERTLQELLFVVVDAPSVVSIALHLGVHVTLRSGYRDPRMDPPAELAAAGGAETRVAPLDIVLNGAEALWIDLWVVQPNGANMVCGGLVGAHARHPTEPARTATAQLIATRRGDP